MPSFSLAQILAITGELALMMVLPSTLILLWCRRRSISLVNNLDLDKNIIKVTIPTVFDCQKSEIKNGTILIEKDIEVTFNFCAFKDLKIENTSDKKTKIEKSIGEVKLKVKT